MSLSAAVEADRLNDSELGKGQEKGVHEGHDRNKQHVPLLGSTLHSMDEPAGPKRANGEASRGTSGHTNPAPQEHARAATVYVAGRGPGDKYKVGHVSNDDSKPPFARIHDMCARDVLDPVVDMNPAAFAAHRRREWPHVADSIRQDKGDKSHDHLIKVYDVVRSTGVPNCLGARIPLQSGLNIKAWGKYVD